MKTLLKNKITKEDSQEMKQLRKYGLSVRKIAKLFNVSHSTIVWHTNDSYRLTRSRKLKDSHVRKIHYIVGISSRVNDKEEYLAMCNRIIPACDDALCLRKQCVTCEKCLQILIKKLNNK